ncbi:hypothetical protein HHL23_12115 [Chryseobacterium sp. RP-3-3]|uniref:Lipoprotein n=1 Tax=Chryseobacterium antibioticum TaxID=2728847 RepID=A0A7Y0FSL1_9FLAO|nr:hypothetical protein [Chryseobacterium antibioticum]NML70544.1 hypothetical protein [Chryseobacterium antibioticum]
MKVNLLLISMMVAVLFSCKEKKEAVKTEVSQPALADTVAAAPPEEIKTDTAVIKEPENIKTEEPGAEPEAISYDLAFNKFPSSNYKFIKKAKLDFSSDEGAYNFRTRIKEAYASGTPDFARYYITVIFGCGASCIMGSMMDVRDGKIYGLPLGEETSCMFAEDRAIFNLNSRLFIASICKESPEDESVYYHAFVWNEDKKVFEKVEEKDIK